MLGRGFDPRRLHRLNPLVTRLTGFILSKNMVVLFFAASIWFCRNHSNIDFCNKILVPLKMAIALFITIKILPNNYSSRFQFALESGIKNYKKFSYCYGRFFEILFLVIFLKKSVLKFPTYDKMIESTMMCKLKCHKIIIMAFCSTVSKVNPMKDTKWKGRKKGRICQNGCTYLKKVMPICEISLVEKELILQK